MRQGFIYGTIIAAIAFTLGYLMGFDKANESREPRYYIIEPNGFTPVTAAEFWQPLAK